ncbi:MAG: peptidase C11 [Lachnospiraceae bacterium]|nr:peptidase C11 [Lachnospiraceae bacterium]
MAPDNRPRSREKKTIEGVGNVQKRGSGLDSRPISSTSGSRPSGGGMKRGGGIGFGTIILIAIVYFLFFRGGSSAVSQPAGQAGQNQTQQSQQAEQSQQALPQTDAADTGSQGTSAGGIGDIFGTLLGGYTTSETDYSSYSEEPASYAQQSQLDMSVAPGARQKFTSIVGQGADVVTIMVYLCGTDLESRCGMGTADLQEMAAATLSDNVRVIVYTGGCKKWKNNIVSNTTNQIYQVKGGGVKLLEKDMGSVSMSDPATLTTFIRYCNDNFPANRNELILWDHGSGSLSGYAYDEKFPKSGSMSLSGIKKAIADSQVKFDFVGFDACLMATVETALMLSDYADYMIASEETEPGVGWYYTNWLTKLSADTGMPTPEIGKNIIDDFVGMCDKKCPGQKATLSVTDLAEVAATVPDKLNHFSTSTSKLIGDVNGYMTVSKARNNTKEFAQSSKIDQIDFIHFAQLLDTPESRELADVLSSCVKYNRTQRNITNANGLSVYFPYKKVSKTGNMVRTYEQIGIDSAYSDCIRAFAENEQSGQSTTDGAGSPLGSLFGSLYGSDYAGAGGETYSGYSDALGGLMSALLTGRSHTSQNMDTDILTPVDNGKGKEVFRLSEDQWKKVSMVDLNVFIDDGEGFIDLGLDNVFKYDSDNNLLAEFDNTWMSINGNVVAYYHTDSEDDGQRYCFNGYVPAYLNGQRVELLLTFSDQFPDGTITGARYVYDDEPDEVDTVAKNTVALSAGDKLEFICRYYDYNGNYKDTFYLGDPLILDSPDVQIANISLGNAKAKATYVFTDMYQQQYWSPVVKITK